MFVTKEATFKQDSIWDSKDACKLRTVILDIGLFQKKCLGERSEKRIQQNCGALTDLTSGNACRQRLILVKEYALPDPPSCCCTLHMKYNRIAVEAERRGKDRAVQCSPRPGPA